MKKTMILVHWLTVILIAMAFLSIEYRSAFGKHSLFHDIMKSSHLYIGYLVLFITIFRLIARQFVPVMSLNNYNKSKLRKHISLFFHMFLYVWLIFIPILGWCIISAKGSYDIPFGLPAILNPMPRPNIIAFRDLHNTWAYIGLWIIIIHASVALIEYYFISRKHNIKGF
ncbi:cytochrome b/b6 domain-containing protein [Francisellaceae bacterium CB299]